VQSPAKTWHYAEFVKIQIGAFSNSVLDGQEAIDRAQRRWLGSHLPCHNDFIPDIGVYLAPIGADNLVYVEKEASEKGLHSQVAHRLGERSRADKIEKQ